MGLLLGTPNLENMSETTTRVDGCRCELHRVILYPGGLTYIVLSTRGCSPWRPDAVMSTARGANKSVPRIFKGRQEGTGH